MNFQRGVSSMGNQSQYQGYGHGFNGNKQEWNHECYNQEVQGNFFQEPRTFVSQQIYQERPNSSSMGQEDETTVMLKKLLEMQNEGHKANMMELDAMNSKVGELYSKFEQLNSDVEDFQDRNAQSKFSQEASSQENEDQRDTTTQMLQQILDRQNKCAIENASRHEEVQRQFEDVNSKIYRAFEELYAKFEKLNDRVNTFDKKMACSLNDFCGAILPNMKNDIKKEVSKEDKVVLEEIGEKANGKRHLQEGLASGINEENKRDDKEETSIYTPKLPFPGRFPTKAKKKEYKLFRDDLAKLNITLPRLDAITEVPSIRKFVKDVIDNKVQVEEILAIHTFGETLKPSSIKLVKVEDPGKFTIPCVIGEVELKNTLVDSGASINVISRASLMRFGITKIEPYYTSITLADYSSTKPQGLIKDYPLLVDGYEVHTDLVVVESVQEGNMPLILGRPFLATAGAQIDFPNKRISLKYLNNKSYSLLPSSIDFVGTLIVENEENKRFNEDDLGKKKSLETRMVCENKTNDVVNGIKKVIASPPRACKKKDQEEENVLGYGNEEALALDGVCLDSLFSITIENEIEKRMEEPIKVKKGKSKKKKKKKSKKKQAKLPPTQVEAILQLALIAIGPQNLQELLMKSLPPNLHTTHASPSSPTQWSPWIPPSPNLPKVRD